MSLMPPPMKATLPAAQVIDAFLTLRNAASNLIIDSRTMVRPVARVRHELMWLLRDLTHLTLADIGQLIGGRDETTVRYGIEQVADRIAKDDDYRREMLFARTAVLKANTSRMTPDLCLNAVKSVLANPELTDGDARAAAILLIEVRHG